MPYVIEELGPHDFERMVQALLVCEFGPTLEVFGTGKDDGRDAVFEGVSPTTLTADDAPSWDGYHVFQAKFCERPGDARANKGWLLAQVRRELKRWSEVVTYNDKTELKRKGRRPDYFIVITNVSLSGHIGGGIDEVESAIREHAADPKNQWDLNACQVWDRSKVERLLDAHVSVRQRFNGLLTAGDVIAALAGGTMTVPTISLGDSLPLLEEHARVELVQGGQVKLGEAGQVANQRLDLAAVAVDLPAEIETDEDGMSDLRVLQHIITVGNLVQRPSVRVESSPHFLIIGGPGQGKTTLGRILVQTYRAALLSSRPNQSPQVSRIVVASLERAAQIGAPRITNRRWPFRVDLAEYASDVAGGAEVPLVAYIARKINAVTGADFFARNARQWLGAWPWLLVLDGYDEVASAVAREQVARAVTALLETAQTEDADLLIVATTRPQGYGNELPDALAKLKLRKLSRDDAVAYATRLTQMRLGEDADKTEVIKRITAAVDDEVTGRLMGTPLQVMILTLLLENRRRPPQDRASLFQAYYDVIYDRELQKQNYLSDVLQDHRLDIDAIHFRVGLTLQIRSEDGGDFDAAMSADELHQIIRQRLIAQEHSGPSLERRVDDLTRAARDRLVLLAATGQDHVGFDLRSLQEFMAAKALTSGRDDDVVRDLTAIGPSAHWRNTWLLAVGTLYREKPDLFDRMLQAMRDVDAADDAWLSILAPIGPRLATDVLEDGLAANNPRHLRLLIEHALETLNGVSLGASRLGQVLADQNNLNDITRSNIVRALERALASRPENHQSAILVLRELAAKERVGSLATKARQMRSMHALSKREPQGDKRVVTLADALPAETSTTWLKGSTPHAFRQDLQSVKTTCRADGLFEFPDGLAVPASAFDVASDRTALQTVVEAIDAIDPQNWSARSAITSLLWRARERLPVAAGLVAPKRMAGESGARSGLSKDGL
ncbi:NACHT domain-containing NTPase [uncultured Serinicoccus sp.]|uniref:NACHT domain-containing protein n=1 Tax=uncultured Serinicoccus sp. TaxID=735514 RepID=UPI002602B1B3|nr:hypothetical protein [uncultured Serinicoccus sp.]